MRRARPGPFPRRIVAGLQRYWLAEWYPAVFAPPDAKLSRYGACEFSCDVLPGHYDREAELFGDGCMAYLADKFPNFDARPIVSGSRGGKYLQKKNKT